MNFNVRILCFSFLLVSYMGTAQETEVQPISEVEKKSESSVFPPKPKNAWELGLHGGHFFIDGDVDTRIPGGYGVGLHLRKAIHYAFSVRADFMYGQTRGLDP